MANEPLCSFEPELVMKKIEEWTAKHRHLPDEKVNELLNEACTKYMASRKEVAECRAAAKARLDTISKNMQKLSDIKNLQQVKEVCDKQGCFYPLGQLSSARLADIKRSHRHRLAADSRPGQWWRTQIEHLERSSAHILPHEPVRPDDSATLPPSPRPAAASVSPPSPPASQPTSSVPRPQQ